MSTRAVYTVKDEHDTFHLYGHCDGYPLGAAEKIADALEYAWRLPRFEAMDFAAAFVRANKEGGGNIYLTRHYNRHDDLDYRYEISAVGISLWVRAFKAQHVSYDKPPRWSKFFDGTLAQFRRCVQQEEALT